MKISTVILGASCLSAGRLFGDCAGDIMIIDRCASVGGEFFNSYRYCQNWNQAYQGKITLQLQQEMNKKGAFEHQYADFFALAPMLYRELIALSGHFMLTTEIAAITPNGDGFKLEVYNQSGRNEIYCDRIIDTTINGISHPARGLNNIAVKRLNAAIHKPADTTPELTGFQTWHGRTDKEMFLSLAIDPSMNWPTARKKLVTMFETEAKLHGARISSIGKEFDYELVQNNYTCATNWEFINPLQYANPLQAIDAGINMAKAGRSTK